MLVKSGGHTEWVSSDNLFTYSDEAAFKMRGIFENEEQPTKFIEIAKRHDSRLFKEQIDPVVAEAMAQAN